MTNKIEFFEDEADLRRRLHELDMDPDSFTLLLPDPAGVPFDVLPVFPFVATNMVVDQNSPNVNRSKEQRQADDGERLFIECLHDLASCLRTGRPYRSPVKEP